MDLSNVLQFRAKVQRDHPKNALIYKEFVAKVSFRDYAARRTSKNHLNYKKNAAPSVLVNKPLTQIIRIV